MSKLKLKVQEEFDRWSDQGRAESMARGHYAMTVQFLEGWIFKRDDFVLDIGCGNGWAVREMLKRGAGKGYGLDLSPKMIDRARALAGTKEEYIVASAENTTYHNNFFDKLLSIESLYYYEHPDLALKEWFRIAKQGAQIGIVIDLFKENEGSHPWVDALSIPVHLKGISEYIKLLEDSGWSNCRHQLLYDNRPLKGEKDFTPSTFWPSYRHYQLFKEQGSLALSAQKQ